MLEELQDELCVLRREKADLEQQLEEAKRIVVEQNATMLSYKQQLADTKMRLLAYEKHYGVMTGAAVSLILTGTLPFKEPPQEQDK